MVSKIFSKTLHKSSLAGDLWYFYKYCSGPLFGLNMLTAVSSGSNWLPYTLVNRLVVRQIDTYLATESSIELFCIPLVVPGG